VQTLADKQSSLGNVMVVDDNPANLKLLEDMLRQHGYEVQSFPRGRLALAAADQEPPDLILLDINMPELNGYEVCERLKSNERLAGIPVVFLSALDGVIDKVKGFRSGGVDYICKPFQFEEVQARVETHLQLRRAQQAEHDLLEKTLGGAVGTLWELVQITSPAIALRSSAIRDIVRRVISKTEVTDAWQYELAATLCLVGCLALSDEVFEKGYRGQTLSPLEDQMFRGHPQIAAQLLSKIPRLEAVAEIIRAQQIPEAAVKGKAAQGVQILQLALALDRRICRGETASAALAEIRLSRRFELQLLDALDGYCPAETKFEVRQLSIRQLCAGMTLDHDVFGANGNILILKAGTVLSDIWIERLGNITRANGGLGQVGVRIPKPASPTLTGAEDRLAWKR
jgi:CheY-like chemotaxis protein